MKRMLFDDVIDNEKNNEEFNESPVYERKKEKRKRRKRNAREKSLILEEEKDYELQKGMYTHLALQLLLALLH